ncbi:hypothetical protein F383_20299 [Gossypium arboreum]|uniref:Uncharacterized protein n=1 Tax=Gossypium arboreum TaxID=29729 RepID=A0A0B0MA52_GOSAR|nr:hypothetical protein F383_38256 [Gossypium arboreum]KHG07906.1 hypothetical protein F383_35198 [Gossypium arboreum]KHG13570.1 hypothetical protein F383_20299 [Gossypium arboreum]
MCCRKRFSPDG